MSDHFREPLESVHVLIVDDEPALLEISRDFLEREDCFIIETARSGRQALAMLEKGDYDVVVSDYQMPGMDGIQLLRSIKRDLPELPFILFTGKGREEVAIEALNHGADFYLQKGGDPLLLYAELSHGIKLSVRRYRQDKAIKKGEERLRLALEASNQGTVDWDLVTGRAQVSDTFYTMLGYRPEEFPVDFVTMGAHLHPDDIPRIEAELMQQYRREKDYRLRFRMRHKNGEYRWVEARGSTLDRDAQGNPVRVTGTTSDITDLMRAEQGHLEALERFNSLNDHMLELVFVHDFEGNFLDANQVALDRFGYTKEEIVGLNLSSLLSQEQEEAARASLQQIITDGGQERYTEYRLRRKDGGFIDLETSSSVIFQDGRPYAIQGIGRDITDRNRAQSALKEAQERARFLSDLLERSSVPFVLAYPDGRIVMGNRAFEELIGYTSAELSVLDWRSDLTPAEWLPFNIEKIQELESKGGPLRYEKEYIRKDGTRVPVELLVSMDCESAAGEKLFYAFVTDITERKKAEGAERRLRDSEARYEELFDAIDTGVAVYQAVEDGRDFIFKDLNRAGQRFGSVDLDDIRGKSVQQVFPGVREMGLLDALSRVWRTGEAEHMPSRVYEDQRIKQWVDNRVYRLPSGEVVAVYSDVTEQKRTEVALLQSQEMLRLKLDSILSPGYQLAQEELGNIIDRESLQALLDDLYPVTQVGMAVSDLEGTVLASTGWQDICSKFHRQNSLTLQNCRESDTLLTEGARPGEFLAYKCKNHMWDMVTPLMIGDKRVGSLFIGQFFFEDEEIDRECFRRQAERYGFDEGEYMEALSRVPRWSHAKVEQVMTFVSRLAAMISQLSFANLGLARTLSQQERSEQALEGSETKYRAYIESTPQALLVVDQRGRYVDVNQAACDMLGYERDELLGMSIADAVPTEDVSGAVVAFEDMKGQSKVRLEMRLRRKDGSAVPIILNGTRLPGGGFMGFCIDITERKRAEEALQSTTRELENFFGLALDLLAIANHQGYFLRLNQEWEATTGYSRAELMQRPFLDFFHPDDLQATQELLVRLMRQEDETGFLNRVRRKDGTYRWLEWRAHPQGGLFYAAARDVTERKLREEALQEEDRKLRILNEITRHDMLNQLTALKGYLELQRTAASGDTQSAISWKMSKIATTLGLQIEFTGDYQNLGVHGPDWQSVRGVCQDCMRQLEMDGVEVVLDLGGPEIFADRLLNKVFYNLLDNSLKHGKKVRRIVVQQEMRGDALLLIYRDDGVGVTDEDRPRLFTEGFGRDHGLGLFLIKEILGITQIGITENGIRGEGARFEMLVPPGRFRLS